MPGLKLAGCEVALSTSRAATLIADDELAVLLANQPAAAVEMKQRDAFVVAADLRGSRAPWIGSGQRRHFTVGRASQLAREHR